MRIVSKLILSFLSFLVLSTPALAERSDREKPVHIEADGVTLDDVRKLSVFQGNVLMVQGTMMLRADRVEAKQNDAGLESVSATGNPVSFRQKRDGVDDYIEGFADTIDYDGVQSILKLRGNARLRKSGDEIRGSTITYDAKTEFYKVTGQQNSQGSSGRVKITIMPKTQPGTAEKPQTK